MVNRRPASRGIYTTLDFQKRESFGRCLLLRAAFSNSLLEWTGGGLLDAKQPTPSDACFASRPN